MAYRFIAPTRRTEGSSISASFAAILAAVVTAIGAIAAAFITRSRGSSGGDTTEPTPTPISAVRVVDDDQSAARRQAPRNEPVADSDGHVVLPPVEPERRYEGLRGAELMAAYLSDAQRTAQKEDRLDYDEHA